MLTPQQAFTLAVQHHQASRLAEAEALYRQVLAAQPQHVRALHYLGLLAHQTGHHELAAKWIGQAIALQPDDPAAYVNLGDACQELGRFEEAEGAYSRALALKADYLEAQANLGVILTRQKRHEEAVDACRRALELSPEHPQVLYNLANALRDCGRIDDAINAYRRAIQRNPDLVAAHNNLGATLALQGQLAEAMAEYRRAVEIRPDDPALLSSLILIMNLAPGGDARSLREEQARWNRRHVEPLRSTWQPHRNAPDPSRRLKIGYVSPDFRSHPVAFFAVPLLEAHDRERFEIYCYASVERPDAVTERLQKMAHVWREVRTLTDAQLAELIREDGIDILVDLAMHATDNRLPALARKPAPVQVSWLAYPGGSGMEAMDYRLTDAYIDPPGQEGDRPGEEVLRLPDSWCCYAPAVDFPAVGPRPAAHTGTVTFGSLNQFQKLHEDLLRCWARVLEAAPDSRLLMICPEGPARERLLALFAAQGISAERLELVAPCPWADYLRLLGRIDVALDAYPCNSMTTNFHALWMGAPVITLAGERPISRTGYSQLSNLGLGDLVAFSEDDYVAIAARLARDLPRLAQLRETLRTRMLASPCMDAPRFTRYVETAFRGMWQRWCQEQQSLS